MFPPFEHNSTPDSLYAELNRVANLLNPRLASVKETTQTLLNFTYADSYWGVLFDQVLRAATRSQVALPIFTTHNELHYHGITFPWHVTREQYLEQGTRTQITQLRILSDRSLGAPNMSANTFPYGNEPPTFPWGEKTVVITDGMMASLVYTFHTNGTQFTLVQVHGLDDTSRMFARLEEGTLVGLDVHLYANQPSLNKPHLIAHYGHATPLLEVETFLNDRLNSEAHL